MSKPPTYKAYIGTWEHNLQWADEMTVELLGYFLQHLSDEELSSPDEPCRLMIVATLRVDEKLPEYLKELLGVLREEKRCTEILLRNFGRGGVKELISSMLHITDVPEEFIECIAENTGGNPLFIVETLKALQEAGLIVSTGDGWKVAARKEWREIDVPGNVELALLRRLENLEPVARELIKVLSVANRPVSAKLVERIARFAEVPVGAVLSELEERGLVTLSQEGGRRTYAVGQFSFGKVVYNNLGKDEKQTLHREFAEALRVEHSGCRDDILEELIYHYRHSGSNRVALELVLRAGERLKAIYANEKAYEYYSYAVEELSDRGAEDPRWINSQECLADLALLLGRYDESERIYSTLLDGEAAKYVPVTSRARYFRQRGKVFERLGDYKTALHNYMQARDLLEEVSTGTAGVKLGRIWTINALGGLYVKTGEYSKAIKVSIEALKLIESTNETIEYGVVFNTIGSANYSKGNLAQAIEFHTRALEIEEKVGNIPEMVLTLNNLGKSQQAKGDYTEAYRCYKRAIGISEEVGDSYGRGLSLQGLGWFYLAVGEVERAEESQRLCLSLARSCRMGRLSQASCVLEASILQQRGELLKAERCLSRALGEVASKGSRWELCRLLVRLGELHCKMGNLSEAEQKGRYAAKLAQDSGISHLTFLCLLQRGRLCRERKRYEEALRVFKEARQALSAEANPELEAAVSYEIAEIMVKLRRIREARDYYLKSGEKANEVLKNVPFQFEDAYRRKHSPWLQWESGGSGRAEPSPHKTDAEEESGAAKQLSLVTSLTAGLASGTSPRTCLFSGLTELVRYLKAGAGFLLRVEGAAEVRVLFACDAQGRKVDRPSSSLAGELIEQVLNEGRAIFCMNTVDDWRTNRFESVFRLNLRSVVVAPIRTGERVTGLLYISNPGAPAFEGGLRTVAETFLPVFALGLRQYPSGKAWDTESGRKETEPGPASSGRQIGAF